MTDKYVLGKDGKTPVPAGGMTAWGKAFGMRREQPGPNPGASWARVAKTQVSERIRVSTCFLGLNHRFGTGKPLVFETMIFGGTEDQYQERYSTWEEAEAGHAVAVARAETALAAAFQ